MTNRYEELLLPKQRDRIVEKVVAALKTQGQLPSKTLNNFRDLFRAGKPIPGFKDPLRAMPPLLKQQLIERLDQNPDLEQLIAGTWAETEPELRVVVSDHFTGLDEKPFLSDDIDEELWDAQIDLLTNEHSDYDEDDILLMSKVCYAHAEMQVDSDEEATARHEPGEPATPEETLDAVLELLRGMPAVLPLWRESVPQFVESLSEIIDEKNEELLQVKGLSENLARIQGEYSSELSFFRHGAEEWDTLMLAMLLTDANGMDESGRILTELETAFQNYRTITGRADTLAEERERREKRHDLEVTIESMLNEIDELPLTIAVESASDSAKYAQSEPDPQLREELDTLKQKHDALLDSNRALTQDADSLSEVNRALQGELTGLNADKQALADEVAELRDQLRISEAQASNWRNAYEAGMSSEDSAEREPIPPEIESVRQAWELARARHKDRLVFRPNKKSELDYGYRRPREVWDALDWLATTYHDAQTGKARVIDLNESIRNTCSGWEYKPNQTDITFNTFREWYETTWDGKPYELREHLAKGKGRDANVIRIAFAWDADAERVIVGYLGPHQRSRSS